MTKNISIFLTSLCLCFTVVNSTPSISPASFTDDGKPTFQFTCSAPLLPGEVLAWYKSKDVVTDDSRKFREFYPVSNGSVKFRVRATVDVYIGLFPSPKQDEWKPLYYEVILGGWENTRSSIRRRKDYKVYADDTPGIVSECEYRGFWILVADDGTISVGHEGQASPFLWWRDPQPIAVAFYAFSGIFKSVGFWKTEETGYPEDEMLGMTQLKDALANPKNGMKMEIPLHKSREPPDARPGGTTRVYCAKHTVLPGGALSKGVESIRIPLVYTANVKLEPPFVKLEPSNTKVYFTANSAQKFNCGGSLPIDGRTYTWFRKDLDAKVTTPETQKYDSVNNINVLHLSLDESYDLNELFCTQGYTKTVTFGSSTVTKHHGELAKSESITLFMVKKEAENQTTEPPLREENITTPPPVTCPATPPPLTCPEASCSAAVSVPLHAALVVMVAVVVAVAATTVVAVACAPWACWCKRLAAATDGGSVSG